jgi:hypothetical protein
MEASVLAALPPRENLGTYRKLSGTKFDQNPLRVCPRVCVQTDGQDYCKRRSAGVPTKLMKVHTLSLPPPPFLVNFRNDFLKPSPMHRVLLVGQWAVGHVPWPCAPDGLWPPNTVISQSGPPGAVRRPHGNLSITPDRYTACLSNPPAPPLTSYLNTLPAGLQNWI